MDFVTQLRKEGREMRVLDLACGAGRHMIYAAKQGLEAHGADFSNTGLGQTKERMKKQKLDRHLAKCDMKFLPYKDVCFDAAICFQAIYHQKRNMIQETLAEIHRILKKNGSFAASFLSKNTYRYRKGAETEKDTFVEQEGVEKGVLHHFVDKKELEGLLKGFRMVRLELEEHEVEGKIRSSWLVKATA